MFLQSQSVFWDTWKKFEVNHGNEDTVREMLRIKRSVQATYNTQVNFMATKVMNTQGTGDHTIMIPRLALVLTRLLTDLSSSRWLLLKFALQVKFTSQRAILTFVT